MRIGDINLFDCCLIISLNKTKTEPKTPIYSQFCDINLFDCCLIEELKHA
jgi:hypothetical protein